MATKTTTLPYESREDSSSNSKGKSKAGNYEVLDRLDGFPVIGAVYRTSTNAYTATKNFNGLTRASFEVAEAPIKVAAYHIDANFGPSLHRADEYVSQQLDKAGEAVKTRLPNVDKITAELKKGPEGFLQVGERIVDQVLPPLNDKKKSSARSVSPPPKSNVKRALYLGVTIADRLLERTLYVIQTLLAFFVLFLGSIPKKFTGRAKRYSKKAQRVVAFFLAFVTQLIPFLNPFYTYRVGKAYANEYVFGSEDTKVAKHKKDDDDDEEDDEDDDDEEREEGSADVPPKVEVSKKKRRNGD